jgi:Putative metal-binding motif
VRGLPLPIVLALGACTTPSPPPSLDSISPLQVSSQVETPVLLAGAHLEPRVVFDLDRPSRSVVDERFTATLSGPSTVALTHVTWIDAGLVAAEVPAHGVPGVYDVELVDPLGRAARLVGALEVVPACPFTYLDQDGDGFGDPSTGAISCAPGRVDAGGDCNDLDPLTHPGAPEVCNGLDDNCDGTVDEGACPVSSPGWVLRPDTGGPGQDWATASSYAKGAVWLAGGSQLWLRPGSGAFTARSAGCPAGLVSSWSASDGWLQAGGGTSGAGRLASNLPGPPGGGCLEVKALADPLVGVVGFEAADGGTELRGVTRRGALARWVRGGGPVALGPAPPGGLRLEDLHGSDVDSLYAVGADGDEGSRMRVLRWADGGWQDERVATVPGVGPGSLHGVWVLGPGSVFAVGDHGTALEKRGGTWRRLPGLDGGTLQAVRAFGVGRVYVVSLEGRVLRWDGRAWTVLRSDGSRAPYTDLTGTAEDDLWGVGGNGTVVHWPEESLQH